MESQVKERIVGAAVLVALGVWLIPWVLDGPDSALEIQAPEPEITLPSADDAPAPIRTETVELDQSGQPAADDSGASSRAESVAVALPAESAVEPDAPATTPEDPTVARPQVTGNETARANPAQWSVQLGAFGEIANAEQMASRVSAYGYTPLVTDVVSGGTTLHRVRVGGFDSEANAEAAASSLSAHGFRVRVSPPEQ